MKLRRYLPIAALLGISATSMAEDEPVQRQQWEQRGQQQFGDREASRVRSDLIPTLAGIDAADKAVAVVDELSSSYHLDQDNAQAAIALARQALGMALDRATALQEAQGLSRNAQFELGRATRSLRQARMSLRLLDQQIGQQQGRMATNRADQIQEQARNVREDLSQAQDAIQRVAQRYDIETDLEFRGGPRHQRSYNE